MGRSGGIGAISLAGAGWGGTHRTKRKTAEADDGARKAGGGNVGAVFCTAGTCSLVQGNVGVCLTQVSDIQRLPAKKAILKYGGPN